MIAMLAALVLFSPPSLEAQEPEVEAGEAWLDLTTRNSFFLGSSRMFVVPALARRGDVREVVGVWLYDMESNALGVTTRWADSRTCPEVAVLVKDVRSWPSPFDDVIEDSYGQPPGPPPPLHPGTITFRTTQGWGDGYIAMTAETGLEGPVADWLDKARQLPCWSSDEATRPPFQPPMYEGPRF
jgi:hypothetical protein